MPNCTFEDFGSVFPQFWLHFGLPWAPLWADFHCFFKTFLVIACLSFVSYIFQDFWSVLLVLWFALCLACLFLGWVVWLVAVSVVSVVGVVGAARAVGVASPSLPIPHSPQTSKQPAF